jgi:hypothetical protein
LKWKASSSGGGSIPADLCSASYLSGKSRGTECSTLEGRKLLYVGVVDGRHLVSEKTDVSVRGLTHSMVSAICSGMGSVLPLQEHLTELYSNRLVIGGFSSDTYWSSTRVDGTTSLMLIFSSGQWRQQGNESGYLHARCVRLY